eukprot:TRINITY_DN16017_c0_g1_i1.p1 TRINITY_DN16017_c0_g1~~TRINITY_DN16017_c0_g1_i1.p1  ORF type:complete len:271 (+),score=33.94 TRINITY_DN16017_c0_g1_i1:48-815(+)
MSAPSSPPGEPAETMAEATAAHAVKKRAIHHSVHETDTAASGSVVKKLRLEGAGHHLSPGDIVTYSCDMAYLSAPGTSLPLRHFGVVEYTEGKTYYVIEYDGTVVHRQRYNKRASVWRHPRNEEHGREIVKRARSRLGEKHYSALFNNCEHFAEWCYDQGDGAGRSLQARVMWTTVWILVGICLGIVCGFNVWKGGHARLARNLKEALTLGALFGCVSLGLLAYCAYFALRAHWRKLHLQISKSRSTVFAGTLHG